MRVYYANLYHALKLKIKNQQEMDEHRRQGHPEYSPDCPECKRGAARQRQHFRAPTRQGGELSVDIGGPYAQGVPVTDRPVAKHQWPKYMLVGALYLLEKRKQRRDMTRKSRIDMQQIWKDQ